MWIDEVNIFSNNKHTRHVGLNFTATKVVQNDLVTSATDTRGRYQTLHYVNRMLLTNYEAMHKLCFLRNKCDNKSV